MNFEYKAIDQEGHQVLDVISSADKFNEWMYNTIKPHCSGSVLEIGSGTGNISQFFIRDGYNITLSDIRDSYCDILRTKFGKSDALDVEGKGAQAQLENFKTDQPVIEVPKKNRNQTINVINLDVADKDFDRKYSPLFETFDTIFALNVYEHIEDDLLAAQNAKKLLKKGGKLVLLVPAYQWLYNNFDKELYHFRRYTKSSLGKLIKNSGYNLQKTWHFNFVGIFGWFFSGRILGKGSIPEGQMGLYNKLVPIFKLFDKVLFNQVGLSVIAVGEKR